MNRRLLIIATLGPLFAFAGTSHASTSSYPSEVANVDGADRLPTITAPPHSLRPVALAERTAIPGEVEISQYGQFEEDLAYRDGGFLAVRFDPPFSAPYTIKSIRFPSYTTDGSPAVFPSIRLLTYTGGTPFLPINEKLFETTAYVGSGSGTNEIPLDLAVTDSGRTFYVCVEFPSTAIPGFPNGFPFMRMDYADLERGLYGNSYTVQSGGLAVPFPDRNVIVSVVCRLPESAIAPIESSSNLGANRRSSAIEFTFRRPRDLRSDGVIMPRNSLRRTLLLSRTSFGSWAVIDSAEPGESAISLLSLPGGTRFWSTQVMDKGGNRAVLSSGPLTNSASLLGDGFWYDDDEPNGNLREGKATTPSSVTRDATCAPAGDQDYYSFFAKSGDVIEVMAAPGSDGKNDLELVLVLFDNSGKVVAVAEKSPEDIGTVLSYSVPLRSATSRDKTPRQYTILIRDIYGSLLSPDSAPRIGWDVLGSALYHWSLRVLSPSARSNEPSSARLGEERQLTMTVTPSANRTNTLSYTLPEGSGATRTSIRVFDLQGRLVRTLLDRSEAAGRHTVTWDGLGNGGGRLPAGVYFMRLENRSERSTTKIVLK